MPTVIAGPGSAAVDTLRSSATGRLAVSEVAAAEPASALSRLARMGRMTEVEAFDRLSDRDDWRAAYTDQINLDAQDRRLAGRHVRRFTLKLRTPDALHVAICRRLDLCVVTLDTRLSAAARELGIEVMVPTA